MFFPINSIEEGDFVDGGLVANHPGFFAMFEAEKYLDVDKYEEFNFVSCSRCW